MLTAALSAASSRGPAVRMQGVQAILISMGQMQTGAVWYSAHNCLVTHHCFCSVEPLDSSLPVCGLLIGVLCSVLVGVSFGVLVGVCCNVT